MVEKTALVAQEHKFSFHPSAALVVCNMDVNSDRVHFVCQLLGKEKQLLVSANCEAHLIHN